ncbi:hypothetical protein MNB_ARC-1_1251 [hydrothermal vent metagenome]|uniref:Endonuclease GajA/Old nuclease/RecF-like AAA domain-containing protein n=1 Tax=hydrothermal vent metagenome TaxID=652676 RepID=A0A3B1E6J9_9ZZZZ
MEERVDKKQNIKRLLKNLYLDPNNYRFIDNKDYKVVSDEDILKPMIQKRTQKFIAGKNEDNISDLITSFKANGFMKVDVIQVKDLGDHKYLVLEGNRRVTALKYLQEQYEELDADIGVLDPEIFKNIPFEIHYDEDKLNHRVIMGLKHIGGNKTWPALNQAQLVYDIVYNSGFNGTILQAEEYAQKSLAITKFQVKRYIRVLKLIDYYKQSDYGDQFETNMYSIFEEVIKKPIIKEWIGFDDYSYKISNNSNLQRLFTWISPEIISEFDEDTEQNEDLDTSEPIITKALEIRTLAEFINDETALKKLEESRDIYKALATSSYVGKNKFSEALKSAENDIENSILFKEYMTDSDIEKIEKLNNKLNDLLPAKTNLSFENIENKDTIFTLGIQKHFTKIEILQYKQFNNFKMNGFKRVNIIAGFNNSGKTTLLEAIYFLTIQNDISLFFDIIKLRNKFSKGVDPIWLNNYLEDIRLIAEFNQVMTEVVIKKYDNQDENLEKINYITSMSMNNTIGNKVYSSNVDMYSNKTPSLRFKNIVHLANSMFKSPYFYHKDDLLNSYSSAVLNGLDETIIDFIKKLNSNIKDIKLIEENGIKRFMVILNNDESPRDITSFGEGLQRIFEISLSFASCENGVLLIDELETAIHKSMLIDFTQFIQELAEKFNVQVFLTSHSKECIDAFVKNNYIKNDELMAFLLENKDGNLEYQYIDGNRLESLVSSMDLDIRGEKSE